MYFESYYLVHVFFLLIYGSYTLVDVDHWHLRIDTIIATET